MKVKIINKSTNELPKYETSQSAGMDVRANLDEPVTITPGRVVIVPTGLFMEIEQGYECQVRPRSGLAAKHGITVLNTPGTIDADYRGEVKVILINQGQSPFIIEHGERIAQLVFAKCEQAELELTEELSDTERGSGGFGHTGKK